ncbi:hypothetical protein FCM35_KLT09301 [Carex littledalei]|uniref:Uncharacterized protein n=1 Tax=Carex littledalei TaxID=544730 RepID=A0A833QQL8_9POAL|nr:hypothetical protein FCM35_KLT09301 [Carex littledalei]
MSWYVFWILDLPLKEASGDSEDRIQEDNTDDDTCRFDENDNGSCCGGGGGNGDYNSDDDDDKAKAEVCFFSKEALEHKGSEAYSEISLKEVDASDEESRQQRLRDDAKQFWEACIAHGY